MNAHWENTHVHGMDVLALWIFVCFGLMSIASLYRLSQSFVVAKISFFFLLARIFCWMG